MYKFFYQNDKKQTILEYLADVNKKDTYHLILVSCYFKLDAAKKLIEELNQKVDISKLSIYIDKGAAINLGQVCINKWIEQIPESIDVSFFVSNCGSLFHPKAYCLLPVELDDLTCGRLVIGSANLTGNGLTNASSGNVELLYGISDKAAVYNFYEDLTKGKLGNFIDISRLENFDTDDYYFKYALVQEGCFIESNNLTIDNLLTCTYKFNKKGQEESKSKEFSTLKLKDRNSYSRNYFEEIQSSVENILKEYNSSYDVEWGRYGIATEFGCWIPKKIVAYLNEKSEESAKMLENCKKKIREKLDSYLEKAINIMIENWEFLLHKDWLTDDFKPKRDVETETRENLKNKIEDFISALDKLLLRYKRVEIPFDFANNENIIKIYDDLEKSYSGKDSDQVFSKLWQGESLIQESTESIIKDYFGSDNGNMLQKCLHLTISRRELAFIRYLDREFYINHVKQNKPSKVK